MVNVTEVLVGIMIAMIIGVVALNVTSVQVQDGTSSFNVTAEAHTGATAYVLDNTHSSLGVIEDSTFRVYNATSLISYNVTTNYNISYVNGTIYDLQQNGTALDDDIAVDYNYYKSGYITNSITRTLLNYIPLLFGVALLMIAAGAIMFRNR